MKIIFLKDVPKIGKKYEVREVADGYGRHIVSKGLAEPATKETLARIEKKMLVDASQKKVHEELLLKTLESLDGASVTLRGKANEKGHLFASIHKEEILAELKRVTRLDMHPDYVVLERPLKELGTYQVPINVATHRAVFTVVVEAVE
jgi:large subunit ribosomal protein L9